MIPNSMIDTPDRNFHHEEMLGYTGMRPLSSEEKEQEKLQYDELLKDGGRQAYPVEMMDEFAARPEKFPHIISPWMNLDGSSWDGDYDYTKVFRMQEDHWIWFRIWQRINRNSFSMAEPEWQRLAEEIGNPNILEDSSVQWYKIRMCATFELYQEAVNNHLVQYGIKDTPTLDREPRHQGKLVTWLEYLSFIYWEIQWANDVLSGNLANGDQFLSTLISTGCVPRTTTKAEIRSMMHDAWTRGEYVDIAMEQESILQQHRRLLERDSAVRNGRLSEAAARDEIQHLGNRWDVQKDLLEKHIEQCWELNSSQYNSKWPWCRAIRDIFSKEKRAIWVRDQIPIVKAEVKARASSLNEERQELVAENHSVVSRSPGQGLSAGHQVVEIGSAGADQDLEVQITGSNQSIEVEIVDGGVIEVESFTRNQPVGNGARERPTIQAKKSPNLETDDSPRPTRRRKIFALSEGTRRSERVASIKAKKEEKETTLAANAARKETKYQDRPSARSRAAPKAISKSKPNSTADSKSRKAPKSRRK